MNASFVWPVSVALNVVRDKHCLPLPRSPSSLHHARLSPQAVYASQVVIWVLFRSSLWSTSSWSIFAASVHGGAFLLVALALLGLGRSVYSIVRNVPFNVTVRLRKLHEVACTTVLCTVCFLMRAGAIAAVAVSYEDNTAFEKEFKPVDGAVFVVFYVVCELLPAGALLYMTRQLPPPMMRVRHHMGALQAPASGGSVGTGAAQRGASLASEDSPYGSMPSAASQFSDAIPVLLQRDASMGTHALLQGEPRDHHHVTRVLSAPSAHGGHLQSHALHRAAAGDVRTASAGSAHSAGSAASAAAAPSSTLFSSRDDATDRTPLMR